MNLRFRAKVYDSRIFKRKIITFNICFYIVDIGIDVIHLINLVHSFRKLFLALEEIIQRNRERQVSTESLDSVKRSKGSVAYQFAVLSTKEKLCVVFGYRIIGSQIDVLESRNLKSVIVIKDRL
ncbi:hypothetical protein D9M72_528690 [compost metagenome]